LFKHGHNVMIKKEKQSILLVDTDPANQANVRRVLRNCSVELVVSGSAGAVVDLVHKYDFALILFAIVPGNGEAFKVARELNKSEKTKFIPVIFQATEEDSDALFEEAYASGGVDFLSKPIHPAVFLAKVKVFLELDDRQRQLSFATAKIQEQNLKLEERAVRDSLTGLYNHNYLLEQLAREVSRARRYDTSLSVFILDLDFFKDVNDSCGHPFGDYVLNEFSARVQKRLRDTDIFGRYGGEEFLIILPSTDSEHADVVAEEIRDIIASTPFSQNSYKRYVTVSIGVYSGFGEKVETPGRVVEYTDNALYQAKGEGRNRVVHYHVPSGSGIDHTCDPLSDMIDVSQQSRLNATIEKARAMTLASFEALVHSQTREYDLLVERNTLFGKVLDRFGSQLNLPDPLLHSFRRAIKLHDLFRCYIHDSSLASPNPLNHEQEEMLFDQPLMLRELTIMFDFFASERVILYSHHEHFDGNGYPDGLKGNEIPLAARIFSLVDAFVAMIAPVSEEDKKTMEEAREELKEFSGSQFDPFLVDILLKTLEQNQSGLAGKKSKKAGSS